MLSPRCDAQRRVSSASSCAFTNFIYALYGISWGRLDAVSVFEYRVVVWRLDAPVDYICDKRRLYDGRCRDVQRRFDNAVS
jgi:hypothetical protein